MVNLAQITNYIKRKYIFIKYILMPDKIYLKYKFKRTFGYDLDLKNPKTFNEKMQWKKLYDRRNIYTVCSDKLEVRDYIKQILGEKYLIPLLGYFDDPNKINFNLFDKPFVIKSNHGSGHVIIVKSDKDFNEEKIKSMCMDWIKTNYYFYEREWQYKNILPKIMIEKLLLNKDGTLAYDYKFHCFNGKVEFIQLDVDRFSNHKRVLFDKNWKKLPFRFGTKKDEDKLDNYAAYKPKNLKRMINISEKLASIFDYVRIDLYEVNGKIYFGEMTFTHCAGFEKFSPKKYDLIYGRKLRLKNQTPFK